LFRYTSTPYIFPALLEASVSQDDDDARAAARRHMRRFPRGTASIALAIAAGGDPAGAGVKPREEGQHYGDPEPCPAIRAGLMLSILARMGCEDDVMAAASALGLEAIAKRWIGRRSSRAGRRLDRTPDDAGKSVTLEGKRLNARRSKGSVGCSRASMALAERDIGLPRDGPTSRRARRSPRRSPRNGAEEAAMNGFPSRDHPRAERTRARRSAVSSSVG
jgi:hypothetical protein